MRYAMIKNRLVDNICKWDGDLESWTPPADVEMVSIDGIFVDIGFEYADGVFTAPESDEQ